MSPPDPSQPGASESRFHLDLPREIPLIPHFQIAGWVAGSLPLRAVRLKESPEIAFALMPRPDVTKAFPDCPHVSGFDGTGGNVPVNGSLALEFLLDGEWVTREFSLPINPVVVMEAARFGVSEELHPADQLLRYLTREKARSEGGAASHYFFKGANDSGKIKRLANRLGLPRDAHVLEFAAGYGRVTRHLVREIAPRTLVASDIHPEAIPFLRRMGCEAFQSCATPEDLECTRRFDFIFVLSLFSHLPDALFARWLTALRKLLKPAGYLMFTTHGHAAMAKVPELSRVLDENLGYGYLPNSDQEDLPAEIYGTTMVTPDYVRRQIAAAGLRERSFAAEEWWDFQDEWITAIG
jgi:SAM-dependent methyltransferase